MKQILSGELLEAAKRFLAISLEPKKFTDENYEDAKYDLENAIKTAEGKD